MVWTTRATVICWLASHVQACDAALYPEAAVGVVSLRRPSQPATTVAGLAHAYQ
jgi:hypothetical protein